VLVPSVITIPYITKSVESSLSQVPASYREGAEALGIPPLWTLRKIVLKSAVPGPRALFIELQPPPPAAVARSLRLSVGQSAATVTVRFDDPARGRPAALTVAVLRADMFRIVVESPASQPDGTADSFSGAWTYAVQDWEP
jgi:hypothetical protein